MWGSVKKLLGNWPTRPEQRPPEVVVDTATAEVRFNGVPQDDTIQQMETHAVVRRLNSHEDELRAVLHGTAVRHITTIGN